MGPGAGLRLPPNIAPPEVWGGRASPSPQTLLPKVSKGLRLSNYPIHKIDGKP